MLVLGNKLTLNSQPIYHFVNKYSIDFDGVDDVIVTDGADTVLQNTTYSMWVKSSQTGANNGVFGHGSGAKGSFHFNHGDKPLLELGGSSYRWWNDNPAQDDGKWHHWVVYLDTDITKSKLYCDGVLQSVDSTVSSGSPNAYTESLNIGGDKQSGGNYFEGKIDEFAVYDRELTQAEITRMYNTYYSPNRVANGNFAQIGNEEVSNGDFSEVGSELVTSWTNNDFSSFASSGSDITQMVSSGSGNNNYSALTITSGKTYKLQFTSSQAITCQIRTSTNTNLTSATVVLSSISLGSNEIYFTAPSNYAYIGFYAPNSFTDTQISGFTLKEVGQDWETYTSGTSTVTFEEGAVLNIDGSNSNVGVYQENVFTNGTSYKIVVNMKATASFDAEIIESQGAVTVSSIGEVSLTTSYQEFTFYYQGTGTNDLFIHRLFSASGSNQKIYIKSASIKEVGQHWTFGSSWSTNGTEAIFTTGSTSLLEAPIGLIGNRTYRVSCVVTGSGLNLYMGTNTAGISVPVGTYNANIVTASNTNGTIGFLNNGGSFSGTLDNIVVQELKSDATNLMLNAGAYQSANPLITSTNSMEFDGVDDTLQLGSFINLGVDDFSLSFWVNLDSANNVTFASKFEDNSNRVIFNTNGANQLSTQGRVGGAYAWNFTGTGTNVLLTPHLNKWTHIAYSIDRSSNLLIFINGVLKSTTSISSTSATNVDNTGNWSFGDADGYSYLNGKMTEVGAYNRALTSLEVASLYNQGMPTNLLVNRNDYQSGNPTVFNTKVVDFDGTDDYLIANSTLGSMTGSLSFWYKRLSSSSQFLMDVRGGGGTGYVFFSGVNLDASISSGTIYVNGVAGDVNMALNEWHHLVVTGITLNIIEYLSIGKRFNLEDFLDGQMSQVGLWNSTLTADEVSSLYNHGLPIDLTTNQAAYSSSSNLVGYWRMGDGTLDTYPLIADQTNATLSAEYVVNGDFSNGTTGWIAPAQDGAYQQLTADGLKMYAGTSQGASNLLSSTTTFNLSGTEGKVYKADIVSSDFVVGSTMYLRLDGVYDANNIISFLTGTQTVYFTAYRDFTFIRFFAGSFEQGFTLKSISIKEVGGNPAMMSNTFAATAIENGSPYANLVQNGDFSEGTTDWTSGAAVTSFTVTNSIATVLGTSSSAQNKITQSIPVTTGNTYKISGSIRSNDGKDYRVRILDSAYVDIKNNNNSSFETFEYERVAQSSFITLIFESWYSDGTTNFSVDYATLEEVNTGLQGYWKMGDGTNDEYPVIYDQTNPTIGSELVVNGTFLTNTTTGWNDWDNLTNPSNTSQQDGYGILDATTGTCDARQQPTVTPGKTYKIEATIKEDAGANAKLYMSDGANYSYAFGNFQATTTETTFVKYVVPTQTVIRLYAYNSGSAKAYFKNISVKEIGGNPATMIAMPEGNITNQFPLTKIRNYYRMGDGILDSKFLSYPATAAPFIFQDQTSPNLAHIPTTNLLSNSNVFVANSATLTPNYGISPDGTQNSTRVETSGNNSGVRISISNSSNNDFAYSVFVKGVSGETVNVRVETSPYSLLIQYNFTFNGEWQRVENVLTASNTHTQKNFYVTHLGGSTATDFQVYGIQIEEQSQATPYLKSDGIAAVRKSSTTNLITYSEDTSQSLWTDNHITWSHNLYPSPIGTNNATKITSTNNGAKVVVSLNLENSKTYTVSMYIKNISTTSVKMLVYQNNDAAIPLNSNYQDELSTTEWVRVKKTFTTTSSAAGNTVQIQPVRDLNSGGEMYIWGLQVEQQTQAETYAPTKGIPVTIDLFTENNYGATQGGIIQKDVPRNS